MSNLIIVVLFALLNDYMTSQITKSFDNSKDDLFEETDYPVTETFDEHLPCEDSHVYRLLCYEDYLYFMMKSTTIKLRQPVYRFSSSGSGRYYQGIEEPQVINSDEMFDEDIVGYRLTYRKRHVLVEELIRSSNGVESVSLSFETKPGMRMENHKIAVPNVDYRFGIELRNYSFGNFYIQYLDKQFVRIKIENKTLSEKPAEVVHQIGYTVKYAAVDFNENSSSIKIYELDHRSNVYFKYIRYNSLLYMKQWLHIGLQPLHAILNCHQPFTHSGQVKGILFNRLHNVFYIFINRFYLKINESLIRTNFKFDPIHYEQAIDVQATQKFLYLGADLNLVKKLGKNLYYLGYMKYFAIGYQSNGDLQFEEVHFSAETELVRMCAGETLKFGNQDVYCFEENHYYFLKNLASKKSPLKGYMRDMQRISDMFEVGFFGEHEKFKFAFDYPDGNSTFLVLMTLRQYYVVNYAAIQVDTSKRLRVVGDDFKVKVYKMNNCLFTPETCTQRPKPRSRLIIPILFIVFCMLLIVLILILLFAQPKKRTKLVPRKQSVKDTIVNLGSRYMPSQFKQTSKAVRTKSNTSDASDIKMAFKSNLSDVSDQQRPVAIKEMSTNESSTIDSCNMSNSPVGTSTRFEAMLGKMLKVKNVQQDESLSKTISDKSVPKLKVIFKSTPKAKSSKKQIK